MRPVQTAVVSSRRLTSSAHAIQLKKPPGFSFLPTQFTFLSLETEDGTEVRPMSIATSPTRPNLEYAVRESGSPFKRAFSSLRAGDEVGIAGPFGRFILDEDRPAVLVAGGIGITPLKGMAEYATDKRLPIPVRLIYSNRTVEETVYRKELEELERRNARLEVIRTITGEPPAGWTGSVGRISPELLRAATADLDEPVYYACGTPSMVFDVQMLLSGLGVPQDDVMVEAFRGYRT